MMIMDATFAEIMSDERWYWDPRDWLRAFWNYATTPFLRSPLNSIESWYYNGEVYDNSSVNYIGIGYAAAHYLCPLYFSGPGREIVKNLPEIWNQWVHGHGAGTDQFWFDKGYELYPGWKIVLGPAHPL